MTKPESSFNPFHNQGTHEKRPGNVLMGGSEVEDEFQHLDRRDKELSDNLSIIVEEGITDERPNTITREILDDYE